MLNYLFNYLPNYLLIFCLIICLIIRLIICDYLLIVWEAKITNNDKQYKNYLHYLWLFDLTICDYLTRLFVIICLSDYLWLFAIILSWLFVIICWLFHNYCWLFVIIWDDCLWLFVIICDYSDMIICNCLNPNNYK